MFGITTIFATTGGGTEFALKFMTTTCTSTQIITECAIIVDDGGGGEEYAVIGPLRDTFEGDDFDLLSCTSFINFIQ